MRTSSLRRSISSNLPSLEETLEILSDLAGEFESPSPSPDTFPTKLSVRTPSVALVNFPPKSLLQSPMSILQPLRVQGITREVDMLRRKRTLG